MPRAEKAGSAPTKGSLSAARAHWVARDTILWDASGPPGTRYLLHYNSRGALSLDPRGVAGGQSLTLAPAPEGPSEALRRRFPHLSRLGALRIAAADLAKVPGVLKGQVAVSARDPHGHLLDATSLQIPGVLDDLYRYGGPLGVAFEAGIPSLRLWAPTARSVTLHLADGPRAPWSVSVPMTADASTGVWSAVGRPDWKGKFYTYTVEVFAPSTGRVEMNEVTDPYSVGLSMNSRRSQILDLADPALAPAGWRELAKPPLEHPTDSVIYELHVRDFSIGDATVPDAWRGTFKAFTHQGSRGMAHLEALARAGLSHVHLLPVFDFATVDEDRSARAEPDPGLLRRFAPDSPEPQALVEKVKEKDGFNWGYDPLHYTVPEGSYSTDPDGPARVLEFREMVQALNRAGLRVVMDVVYNHTHASGQDEKSVLDRVVPGYYHRLNAEGKLEASTCCANTASEHAMMEKLIVDSVLTWAREHKLDGFRFDLMGHHMLATMKRVRAALDALTLERDGVDGRSVYVYGEGWDFGEVAVGARGVNATQRHVAGTGIGVFNDRLRDAARGGGAFSGLQEQGFLTGLYDDPNGTPQGSPDEQRHKLLRYADWIRLGIAGNLVDYRFQNAEGHVVTGHKMDYGGQPAGYTRDPQENVVYVSAHDNETLFDAIQLKSSASATLEDRVRMHNLGLSLVMLAQGVPFFHAGDDMLRSKSLDRNSYNSGDWFNALDWSCASNNWGVGLPPGENRKNWSVLAPLLAEPRLRPGREHILAAVEHFREMLRIRRSTRLLRLRTGAEVRQRVFFYNTGKHQVPGVIVMAVDNAGQGRIVDPYAGLVAVLNATRTEKHIVVPALKGAGLELHEVQARSSDPVVRTARFESVGAAFVVPGRRAAVFVLRAR